MNEEDSPTQSPLELDLFGYPYIWTVMERLAQTGMLGLALHVPAEKSEVPSCFPNTKKS